MPCSAPLDIKGVKVACRSCDFCVGRRIHSWCARAMMEKESLGQAVVLALSYSEETEHSRRSARVFDYKDVQELLWRVRRGVAYHLKRTGVVSFIAAGEQGERNGRCHWHIVIFSEVDVLGLGKWSAPYGPCSDRSEIITPDGKPARRRLWSLWPHGQVVVQEPDYGGMRYALAYALKDQFNVRNSVGTMREAKSEVFATGYLGMSKKPPIGARWIDAYVDRCRVAGVVPPTRQITVDGLERPFWPTGLLAERLLAGLASVNSEIRAATGADGAGWSTLLHEARLSDSDLETLGVIGVEENEEKDDSQRADIGIRVEDSAKWATWRAARAAWHEKDRQHWRSLGAAAGAARRGPVSSAPKETGNG